MKPEQLEALKKGDKVWLAMEACYLESAFHDADRFLACEFGKKGTYPRSLLLRVSVDDAIDCTLDYRDDTVDVSSIGRRKHIDGYAAGCCELFFTKEEAAKVLRKNFIEALNDNPGIKLLYKTAKELGV